MADPIDTRAFDFMTTAVDKTAVSLFEPEDEKGTEGIHTALLAAGMTPAYGNIADIADATLYALEGEFGEAGWSLASAIPVIGQMVAGKRVLKAAKEAGEEIITLYRGIPKWFPGKMVKEGNFIGGKKFIKQVSEPSKDPYRGWKTLTLEFQNKDWQSLEKAALWVTGSKKYAKGFVKNYPGSRLLEFEVPKSWMGKYFTKTGQFDKEVLGFFNEGLPKGFLKKVHK